MDQELIFRIGFSETSRIAVPILTLELILIIA